MRTTTMMQRNARPVRREAATHLFAVGQPVRLKGGFGTFPKTSEIYRITARLPPREDSAQYRIRNDGELHERVATQDSLEPVATSPGDTITLIERTFAHGKGTETLEPGNQEAEAGKGPAQA
ncbi:hypothetical protein [Mesorhizobium sp. WSM4313]|uniref:hypothetical protein n=1 Tax=Mesorhizobium sp. WSM4313 TaxID=2029412 RepID=UPI000BAFF665|nr:hypothetical protein [Mesorhizobium sp. WSM4313]PBB17459.1 hypothetical protein CK219_24240 [Mesorhizobium sp. WSM4313]